MARPCARRSLRRNPPPTGKDDLAGAAPINDNGTPTCTPAVSLAPAPPPAPAPDVNPTVRYTEADLQRIIRTVLDARPPAPAPQALVLPEGPRKRPLKARAPDLYRGKTHMECYNFCRQCENHFATAGATGLNRVPFAATFFKKRALFCWQQHQRKYADKTDVPITWEEFKAFLQQSLGESKAFVDSIWNTIRKDFQYQLEEVLDWAAHLEHLQTVLKEFDLIAALNEAVLIWHFRDGLKPSIQAQSDKRGREVDTWEMAIKKAIDAEAKAARQLPS